MRALCVLTLALYFNLMGVEMGELNEFIDYCLSCYEDMTREEALIGLGMRMECSDLNSYGKPYKDIPVDFDSFDREYVWDMVLKGRG